LADPSSLASEPPNTQPSPEEIMRQQEEKLRDKYGDLKPKKKLIHKVGESNNEKVFEEQWLTIRHPSCELPADVYPRH
jgi:hypothetical protein